MSSREFVKCYSLPELRSGICEAASQQEFHKNKFQNEPFHDKINIANLESGGKNTMRFEPLQVQDHLGRTVILRSAEISDAEALVKYMKITSAETPFLIREADEFHMTMEQEETFIRSCIDSAKDLMLIATINGEHAGNCSLMSVGTYKRYRHRCEIAIALYQKYCGTGIGTIMLETVLSVAKELGYEQAELEVIEGNKRAVKLYQKLGFRPFGTFPNNMKYADGTYADAVWMMKKLNVSESASHDSDIQKTSALFDS